MYCIKCGVKLADTEKICPLCNTTVYHPDIKAVNEPPLYPKGRVPKMRLRSAKLNGAIIFLFLIPMLICLLADKQTDGAVTWFGFVAGALILTYITLALPLWFNRPNPVIFVPVGFVVTGLYLLYIDLAVEGGWFMSFAFPVVGTVGLITTAVVALVRYIRKGHLYIYGGALIALGGFMLLLEYLLSATFDMDFYYWSIFPLIVFSLLGFWLIFLAIHKPTRETIKRKFFY